MSDSIELGFDLDALLNSGNKNGGLRRKTKTEYLKTGTAFYRILPSFDPVDRRINYEYYMHWITGENGQKMKVQCTKSTEGHCPLCDASKMNEESFERAKANGSSDEQIKRFEEAAKSLRASRSVYFNALNAAGEVVVLELNITATKLLAKKMEEAKSLNFDPTHPKTGVWFKFSKAGSGRDAYEVDFKKISIMVDGESAEKRDRTPIADDLLERIPTSVADLKNPDNMYVQVFSSKDLAAFVRGTPLVSKYQKKSPPGTGFTPTTSVQADPPGLSDSDIDAPPAKASSSAAEEVAKLRALHGNKN
jgi:hypothetical protein